MIDSHELTTRLSELPHRAVASEHEPKAVEVLTDALESIGARVEIQTFRTHKTYLTLLAWLLGGIVIGLLALPALGWVSVGVVGVCVVLLLLYFDWRPSPAAWLPPLVESRNVIGTFPDQSGDNLLILMGHYDSAPVSFLYRKGMVEGFYRSLMMNMAVVVATFMLSIAFMFFDGVVWTIIRYVLSGYFVIQMILASVDFIRYGFTNGAGDNATGASVAVAVGERLKDIPNWRVEIVVTGAEEAGMVGAQAYYRAKRKELDPQKTFLLNFDSLGSGKVKVITRTGSLTPIDYDNRLTQTALDIANGDPRFADVGPSEWHTGDFDSAWFARGGIPSLTISAQDDDGQIPFLHRPEDVLANVDPAVSRLTVDFAEAVLRKLMGPSA